MSRENTSNDIFVDLDAESDTDRMGNSWTTKPRISPLEFDYGVDEGLRRAFWTRPSIAIVRKQATMFTIDQGGGPLSWSKVSGRGSVYTFTIAYRPPHPMFRELCPLVIAIVKLEEGPRMITNVVNCELGKLQVGMPVQVTFETIDDSDILLPVFEPA